MQNDTQNRNSDPSQLDPQMVSKVTAIVMKTLQSTSDAPAPSGQTNRQPEPKTIDLVALFFAVIEKFWLVVLLAVLGAFVMSLRTTATVTIYSATAKLYIVDTSSGAINFANLQLGTALTMDYQEVFKTWEVHEMVIEELNLPYSYDSMQGMISVTNPEDTRILYITATNSNPKLAADIANAYAKAAKTFIINTMRGEEPSDFSIALQPSTGRVVSRPGKMTTGFLLGSVLGIGIITLLFVLDNRPRSPESILTYGGIPTLAVFPTRKRKKSSEKNHHSKPAVMDCEEPALTIEHFVEDDFVSHEAMNTLCTNLSYCGTDIKKIMITSRYPREGKSYVSMTLMRTLAKLGRRVVLIDTDLRASGIQADYQLRYNTQKHYGLSEYLSNHCELNEVLYKTNIPGAYMIPAGHHAPNPLQLLDTEMMKNLTNTLSEQFDVVLIDTPPVVVLSDAVALAKFCDGTLLVVGYRKGNQREIGEVVDSIRQTGCKMLGAVLNGVKFKGVSNRYYYYKSGRYSGHYSKYYRYGRK